MKDLDYGKGYKYAHDFKEAYVPQDYLPEKIKRERFYQPTNRGYEDTVKQRLEKWRFLQKQLRNQARSKAGKRK
jgi:putative ATPase